MICACAVLLVAAAGSPVRGEGGSERRTAVVKVYEKAQGAVVNISGQRVVTESGGLGFDWPEMFDLWGPRYRRQVQVLGSGVVAHEDGYIITNAHVVAGATRIKAVFSDGREFVATLVSADRDKDLAILRIKPDHKLEFIELGKSDDLMIGETVVAIGNPYGYSNTVTSGIVSALGRDIEVSEGFWLRGLIQTDAPINPGNSGGPLLNINGQLIGINTAIRAEAQNIGFAIPVDTLVDNLRQMLMPEKLRRVRLGLVVGRKKSEGEFTGLQVDSVVKGSPADEKGISTGDIILSVDGRKMRTSIDFYVGLMDKEVGEPIDVEYVKPGALADGRRSVTLRLEARPLPDGRALVRSFFQMDVSMLTAEVARKFDFESAYPVLIVTRVERGGVAEQVGLEPGDLVLEIDGATVSSIKELSLAMEKVSEGDLVELKIMRITVGLFGQVQRQYRVVLEAKTRRVPRHRFSSLGSMGARVGSGTGSVVALGGKGSGSIVWISARPGAA